jgi:glycosyltransferase involved in cell wall biosynthesis
MTRRSADVRLGMPALNGAATLEYTLTALLNQLSCQMELVVADSGSTDGTLQMLDRREVPHLFVPPGNMYAAVNAALKDADAEWFGYVNTDDLLFPSALANLVRLGRQTGADVVYGDCDYIDAEGRFLHAFKAAPGRTAPAVLLAGILPFAQPAALFRRTLFEKLDGFCTTYRHCADYDFFLRAALAGARFERLPGAPVAAFRLHGAQLSNKGHDDVRLEHAAVRASHGVVATPAQTAAAWRWRAGNLNNYLIRLLRAQALTGKFVMPRSSSSAEYAGGERPEAQ